MSENIVTLDCLVVKPPWIDLIMSGQKTLELRGAATRKRGCIGLVESGTSTLYGLADLINVVPLQRETLKSSYLLHRVSDTSQISYKNIYGWQLNNIRYFANPFKFNYPQGAVVWVKVDVPECIIQAALPI